MSKINKLNGAIYNPPSPKDYKIAKFNPYQDEVIDNEFMLQMPNTEIILNQDKYSSCVAHAFVMAFKILQYRATRKWIDYDPYVLYGTRYADHHHGLGMAPEEAAEVALKEGFFFRRDFGIEEDPPTIIEKVSNFKANNPDKVAEALNHTITGYATASSTSEIKKFLKLGMPVIAMWELHNSFYNTPNTGYVTKPTSSDPLVGNHEMTIVGWTDTHRWIVVNQWGVDRGFKGVYYIPFTYTPLQAIAISDTIIPYKTKASRVVLQINNTKSIVDGETKVYDTCPVIVDDRTFVPVRVVSENLGASVEWISEKQEIIIRSEECILVLHIGDKKYTRNGEEYVMDATPFIDKNNRTMIPIRLVAESFNCTVEWNGNNQQVIIKSI